MKKLITPVLVICLLMIAQLCKGQNNQKEKKIVNNKEIVDFVNYCYSNKIFDGSALVIKNDTIIYKKHIGYENYKTKDTLKDISKFNIASVSKPFTALAIMQLKEKGLLNYDDPIGDYLEDFSTKKYKKISIRHLLTHTSGIPNHYDVGMQKKGMTNNYVLKEILKYDLLFKAGEKYNYSNTGYMMLADIVKKVSKQSFRDYVQDNIFDPSEMTNSTIPDEFNKSVSNLVQAKSKYGNPHNYPFFTTGSGNICTSAEDLMRFDRALYTNKIIKQETLLEAFEPYELNNGTKSNYGLGGWFVNQNAENKTEKVFHPGGAAGYAGFLFRDMKNKHTVIFLASNKEAFNLNAFADALTAILYDKKIKYPKIPISIAINTEIEKNKNIDIQAVFNILKKKDTLYKIEEEDLNELGYHLLEKKQLKLGNDIFKINVDMFPKSWNVYDSYAESFLMLNDIENAKKYYLKSLQLNPEIKNPKKEFKKMLEKLNHK